MSCFIYVSCDELLLIDLHITVAIKSDCRYTMAFGWVKIGKLCGVPCVPVIQAVMALG